MRSENWNREYAERASELAKAIAARKVPFLWVGVPSFKSSKTMLDMLAFNDIYRAAAASAGGEFVDIWDGFVDENGAYMPSGPDINGQPARLRANDGINLARPGKRKIAFYAEKPLYKVLGMDPTAPGQPSRLRRARPTASWVRSGRRRPSSLPTSISPSIPTKPGRSTRPACSAAYAGAGRAASSCLAPLPSRCTGSPRPPKNLPSRGWRLRRLHGRADQFAGPQLASIAAAALRSINIDRTTNKIAAPSVLPDEAEDRASPRTGSRRRADCAAGPRRRFRRRRGDPGGRAAGDLAGAARPAVAALPPSMTTPATIDKAIVPDTATGDARDLSPSRGAPQQAYKRPKSIGPEGNRAPTRVPQPIEQIYAPAEIEPEVPSARDRRERGRTRG